MRRLILAALLVLLAASQAFAQTGRDGVKDTGGRIFYKVGGVIPNDSTMKVQPYSADGYPLTQEVYPDWGLLWKYQSICQNTLTNNGAAADSSQAYNTLGANWLVLRIHYAIPITAIKTVRLAVQVRGGYNSGVDSTSIAGFQTIQASNSAAIDSLPGGRVGSRNGPTNGIIGQAAVMQNEIEVWLPSTQVNPSRDIWLPLCLNGVWFRAPYTSIRWRVISAYDANLGAVTTGSTTCQIDLIGGR